MVDPGFDYVKVQWGIWRAGGIAVPLCLTHPLPSLQYVLEDTATSTIVVSPAYADLLSGFASANNIRLIVLGDEIFQENAIVLPEIDTSRAALILYTSGTTNKPKVVLTHANLEAQMENLVQAWAWTEDDNTLCVLPCIMYMES